MKYLLSTLLLALGAIMLGCQSAGAISVPAKMSEGPAPSACIEQMQNFISAQEARGGHGGQRLSTRLTPAAFANSSFLSIAQAPLLDDNGLLAQGRERNMPSIYHLSKGAAGCTIIREADKTSLLLTHCTCAPIS